MGHSARQANQDLEAIDAMLREACRRGSGPDQSGRAIVAVVSDHGFTALTHRINLYIPFLRAGLIRGRAWIPIPRF